MRLDYHGRIACRWIDAAASGSRNSAVEVLASARRLAVHVPPRQRGSRAVLLPSTIRIQRMVLLPRCHDRVPSAAQRFVLVVRKSSPPAVAVRRRARSRREKW